MVNRIEPDNWNIENTECKPSKNLTCIRKEWERRERVNRNKQELFSLFNTLSWSQEDCTSHRFIYRISEHSPNGQVEIRMRTSKISTE